MDQPRLARGKNKTPRPGISRQFSWQGWLGWTCFSSTYFEFLACYPAPCILFQSFQMGLLASLTGPLGDQLSNRSTGVILAATFAAFFVLLVVLNILRQSFFRNPHEPPVVFHWVPFIGSTISYGIDPYIFFFRCREKVRFFFTTRRWLPWLMDSLVWGCLHIPTPGKEDDRLPGDKGQ